MTERRRMTTHVGWVLTATGGVLLTGAATILWVSAGDPWATAGLVLGMVGGGFIGTGGSVIAFPEEDDHDLYPGRHRLPPDYTPPTWSDTTATYDPCFGCGHLGCEDCAG